MSPDVSTAIDRCRVNGERLLEDAELLFGMDRYSTALALAVLSQEDSAKAFFLKLVHDDVLPWTPVLRRALRNHECKHLLTILMEWLHQSGEEFLERLASKAPAPPFEGVPDEVAAAINILRHEKLERFERGHAFREPEWGGIARKLAEGMRERAKQAALYISLAESGFPDGLPSQVQPPLATQEIHRAKRLTEFVRFPILAIREYSYLKEVLKLVFAPSEIISDGGA